MATTNSSSTSCPICGQEIESVASSVNDWIVTRHPYLAERRVPLRYEHTASPCGHILTDEQYRALAWEVTP